MNKIINYLFIIITIVKPAIDKTIISIDGMGRWAVIMMALVLFINIRERSFRKILKTDTIVLWTVWAVYVSIVWSYKGLISEPELPPFFFLSNKIFLPLIAFLISYYECSQDARRFTKVVEICFFIYVILALLLARGPSVWGIDSERGGGNFGNILALNAVCLFAIVSFRYIWGWCGTNIFIVGLILSVATILWVATRKALAAELIILLTVILIKYDIRKFKNILGLAIVAAGLYFFIVYAIDNTLIAQRFIEDNSAERYNTTNSRLLNIFGDRAFYYITGWELFKDNLWFGIGLNNFVLHTKQDLVIHSEYMVQLCECGIVGFILFVLFNLSVFFKILKAQFVANNSLKYLVLWGYMACLLFISFTAWTYSFAHYFIVIGITIGLCSKRQLIKERIIERLYQRKLQE